MADITAWSPIDESNVAAPPDGWPEFMPPSMVNNGARAIQGAVRRWYDQVLDGSLHLPYVSSAGGGMTGGLTVNSPAGISVIGGGITASGLIQGGTISTIGTVTGGTVTAGAGGLGTTGNLNVQGVATFAGSVTIGAMLQTASLSVVNVATVGALQSANDISANGTVTGAIVASAGAINAAGTMNAAQYNIHGLTLATSVGSATSIWDGSGSPNIVLDSGGDNFYRAVNHSIMDRSASVSYAVFNSTGTYNASGSWLVISDEEAKADVAPYSRGLSAIQALRPISFKYAAGPFAGDETRYGLIAQDMQTVVPEMVAEVDLGGERFLGLQPGMLIWLLINGCQELAARVEALEGAP